MAALEGHYGNYYHPAIRHRVGSSIPINLNYLTHVLHIFSLEHVVKNNKYIHLIKNGSSDTDVDNIIQDYRNKITHDFRGKLKSKEFKSSEWLNKRKMKVTVPTD